ncbi:Protein breast cancer susceptibility 1 like [Apostasia shenzhenica]|uniref:Protein breast cancer susceptibility 1 like n=1 Tax=Apostasia shenzhenica TaxID=1088818 RepID=A0A2H9ZTE8_9ASPA|nr:Protein breast cancer susceptibility 1 like [Apostasia shenzhenica]
MADFVHLEKMGRELKCPICLSLLKSAVSLACNHVFCNLCIVESMRSVSNCPVCKLPFRRREIHPAPHMDNLVSIYKSMEAASGLSIFTTQVGPSKNSEVEPVKCAAENKCSTSNTHLVHKGRSRGKRMSNRKRKNFKKSDTQNSDPSTSTRSFPSNKRVHVTPYPVSETSPTQHNKVSKLGNSTIEADNDSGLDTNQLLGSKRQEEHSLPPLFWLKEADEEDEGSDRLISQETNDLSSSNCVPCFSDLKDSDDNVSPRQVTPVSSIL